MKIPNPILRHPVNSKCLCGSGKKFKKCCRSDMPSMVSEKDYELYMELLNEYLEENVDDDTG